MKKTTISAKAKIATAVIFAALLLNSLALIVSASDEYEDTGSDTSYEETMEEYEEESNDYEAELDTLETKFENEYSETETETETDAVVTDTSFGIEGPSGGVVIHPAPEVVQYGIFGVIVVDADWNHKTGVDFEITSVETGEKYSLSVVKPVGATIKLPVGDYTLTELPGPNNEGFTLGVDMPFTVSTENIATIIVQHKNEPVDPPVVPPVVTEPPVVTVPETSGGSSYGKTGKSTDSTSDSRSTNNVTFDPFRNETIEDDVIESVVGALEIDEVEVVSDVDDSFMYNSDDTANPDTGKGPAYSLYAITVFAAGLIAASVALFVKSNKEGIAE